MALSVQTNNAAMTALKHLNTNNDNMNKSLERLSSGFRINSAADDAAGYAISSKLDAQTSRLKAASQNVTQGQAMVKMADAAVNEIQNMVVRIESLAVQASSANNANDLGKLDAERLKLEGQIDKIANGTNYNGTNLLNGIDANSAAVAGTATTMSMTAVTAGGAVAGLSITASSATFSENATFSVTQGASGEITSITSDVALTDAATGAAIADAGVNLLLAANGGPGVQAAAGAITVQGVTFTSTDATTAGNATAGTVTATNAGTGGAAGTAAGTSVYAGALAFQVGADNNANNQVTLDLTKSYSSTGLNLGSGTGAAAGGNLLTQAGAQTYIDTAKAALDTLTVNRADLGATQNQLSFVSANLATSIEQSSAAVSSIRDADMALEMAEFTKNQVLTQASTSMLAQANQASQNVLSLFR